MSKIGLEFSDTTEIYLSRELPQSFTRGYQFNKMLIINVKLM